MKFEKEIKLFKMQLLRKMPFYGDILMHIRFVESRKYQTAATNGTVIWYNPGFFAKLTQGERNFVLMHEVFHVLLRHGARNADRKKDDDIWNTACDIIVNSMLLSLQQDMKSMDIPFVKPSVGVFAIVSSSETAENLYSKILADNENKNRYKKTIAIRNNYSSSFINSTHEVNIPSDVLRTEMSQDEINANEQLVKEMISNASHKNRGNMSSYYVPSDIYKLTESKRLDWKKLLKSYLSQEIGDDTSYTTPERKYLHMDLILPGHSLTESSIEEVWAFVDSSGSVSHNEMEQFLTQLHRITREFRCVLNICYWNTSVCEVHKKIIREDDVFKHTPRFSGGTDINCVYDWIYENRLKPDVMIILTDGYFGPLTTQRFSRSLGKKTVLVLSSDIMINDDMKKIGKIAKL